MCVCCVVCVATGACVCDGMGVGVLVGVVVWVNGCERECMLVLLLLYVPGCLVARESVRVLGVCVCCACVLYVWCTIYGCWWRCVGACV